MIFSVVALSALITSCSSDYDSLVILPGAQTSDLTLNLNGLEALGDDFVYEGWIIVDGEPVSTGTFSSVTFPQTFSVNTA
ncbi:anti-sigma factor [Corallibacter sp.]|uniref:anti-sigma factor n=1 Tax=Corallibacter sp. TaxID=2038084 RepID=UPI003AB19157